MVVRCLLVAASVLMATLTGCSGEPQDPASGEDEPVTSSSGQSGSTTEVTTLTPTCDTVQTVAAELLRVTDLQFSPQSADGLEGGAGSGCDITSATIGEDAGRQFLLSASAVTHGGGAAGMAEYVETRYGPLEDRAVDVKGADQAYLSPGGTGQIQLNAFRGNVYVTVLSQDSTLSPAQNTDRASKVASAVLAGNTFS